MRVDMPSATCTLAIAKADMAIRLVAGGKTARSRGFKVDAYNNPLAMYVETAKHR